jgi:CPA2 family monovalent cation:H+ antiporter-2
MSVDPALMAANWHAVLLFTAVVLIGKTVSVSFGSFLAGNDLSLSVRSGMSMAQIGEFSFIIAGVGVATGATTAPVLPVIVAVAVLTTFLTPWFVRWGDPLSLAVERRLPHRLQTFMSLYAGWWATLRGTDHAGSRWALARRMVRQIAVDAVLLVVVIIGTSTAMPPLARVAHGTFDMPPLWSHWLLAALAVLAALPFCAGILRSARRLGALLAHEALPAAAADRADFAEAPRRALVLTLQLAILAAVLVPLIAVTQPFVPLLSGAPLLVGTFLLLGILLWRRATNLQEHVHAGARIIADALALPDASPSGTALEQAQAMLPGLGTLTEVPVRAGSAADGRTLSELDLRARTGATVVTILRGKQAIATPSGGERLRAGDRLAVAGTEDALAEALLLLNRRPRGPTLDAGGRPGEDAPTGPSTADGESSGAPARGI